MSHPIVISDSYLEWLGIAIIISAFATAYHHIECHQEGCHRLGRFVHGHYKLCHVHHPLVPSDGKINKNDISKISQQ